MTNQTLDEEMDLQSKNKMLEKKLRTSKILSIAGTAIMTYTVVAVTIERNKPEGSIKYSNNKEITRGYIAPEKSLIYGKDLDGDNSNEVVFQYNDKKYLLKDINGRPTCIDYIVQPETTIVKPAKIVETDSLNYQR